MPDAALEVPDVLLAEEPVVVAEEPEEPVVLAGVLSVTKGQ